MIYGGTAPALRGTLHAPLRAVPVFCLVVVCILAASALATYRRSAAGAPGDGASAERAGRTRFLAGVAMMTGGVAALVILAQWLAVIMFQPCLQA